MTLLLTVPFVLLSYLLGSVPSGYLVGKLVYHKDIRKLGSGNIGATNVLRVLGKRPAAFCFIADPAKGFISVWLLGGLATRLAGTSPELAQVACGAAAIAGHNWPVFLRFHGGKGVNTSLGVFLAIAPMATLCAIVVFGAAFVASSYVSVGSLAAAVVFPIAQYALNKTVDPIFWFACAASLCLIIRHKGNLTRLIAGRELRAGDHRPKAAAEGEPQEGAQGGGRG